MGDTSRLICVKHKSGVFYPGMENTHAVPTVYQQSRFSQIVQDCLDLSGIEYEEEVRKRTEAEFPGWTVEFVPICPVNHN